MWEVTTSRKVASKQNTPWDPGPWFHPEEEPRTSLEQDSCKSIVLPFQQSVAEGSCCWGAVSLTLPGQWPEDKSLQTCSMHVAFTQNYFERGLFIPQ